MYQPLLQTALQLSTVFCKAKKYAIETQSEKNKKNKHFLKIISDVPPINTPKQFLITTCLTCQIV